jgi:chemotaxis response regulator CheB
MTHEVDPEGIEIRLLLEAIHARYGFDLREYAKSSMRRRVHAALARSGLAHLGELHEDKAPVVPGRVHLCPANYHLLIEEARTSALSVEPSVHFARPSIDVLFESAAVAYGPGLVGVLLSGASADGAAGLGAIKARGGTVFCQAPESAIEPIMPRAGCAATRVDRVASPELLGRELSELSP